MESYRKEEISAKFANMSLLCAFMVVGIHVGALCTPGSLSETIMSVIGSDGVLRLAVPFFFLASGYWLANSYAGGKPYGEQLRRRMSSLLIPYVIWNLLWVLFSYVTMRTVWIHSFPTLINAFGLNPFERPAMGFLWFVRFLMFLVLVSPFVYRTARWRHAVKLLPLVFLAVGTVFMFSVADKEWYLLFEYGFCVEGLFCFFAGMVFWFHPIVLPRNRMVDGCLLAAGLGMFVLRTVAVRRGFPLASYWCSWFGIVTMMYAIWRLMPTRRFPAWLTTCAFPIYLVHPFFTTLLAGVVRGLGWRDFVLSSGWVVPLYFARVGLVVVLTVCLVVLLRRFLPRVSSVLFGGR